MHRELKRETARPAAGTSQAQQRRFDAFRRRYNDERPHEGIGDCTPTSLWMPSTRSASRGPTIPPTWKCDGSARPGRFGCTRSSLFSVRRLRAHHGAVTGGRIGLGLGAGRGVVGHGQDLHIPSHRQ
ncbi:MAG: transposase [Acidobacteriota bacterium]|nr:transposase [Acidobacteriota bacterium]